VAARTRTLTARVRFSPTRRTSRSCSTRSSCRPARNSSGCIRESALLDLQLLDFDVPGRDGASSATMRRFQRMFSEALRLVIAGEGANRDISPFRINKLRAVLSLDHLR